MPQNHPLVAISNLFAEAVDADGAICRRFTMKIIKRLARNADTGALERPLRAVGKHMLVELREQATSNTTAGSATANLVSDAAANIADASHMMLRTNGQEDSAVASSSIETRRAVKIAISSRIQKAAARKISLKNLIGGTAIQFPSPFADNLVL